MKELIWCKIFFIMYIGYFASTLLLLIEPASGASGRPDMTQPIKCYQCNSYYDRGCADFFDNRTYPLKPCPTNITMCRKIIQETYYDGMWDVRFIRQCALTGMVGPWEGRWCNQRIGTWRVKTTYCHCDNKDGCNTASCMDKSQVLGFTLVAALFYFLCRLRTA